MKQVVYAIWIIAALAAVSVVHAQFTYAVTDLGTLGGDNSHAHGINNSNQIVGVATDAIGHPHAFLFQYGAMTDLGSLPGGTSFSDAGGINEAGQIVGSSQTGSGYRHAFLFYNGVMTDLGTISGFPISSAGHINNSGVIVGDVTSGPNNATHATVYSGGALVDIGTLPGSNGSYSAAVGINSVGQIVGSSISYTGHPHAFIYSNGVMTDLNSEVNLTGTNFAALENGIAITDTGLIAGNGSTTLGLNHAFLYNNGIVTDLGALAGGVSFANGMNSLGDVVGYSYTTGVTSGGHAFLYSNGVMQDLPLVADFAAAGFTGISGANAINDNGWIIGSAIAANGEEHALLLTPIPEPATCGICLGVASFAAILVRRKWRCSKCLA